MFNVRCSTFKQGMSPRDCFIRIGSAAEPMPDLDRVEYLGSGMPRILKAYSEKAFRFTENFTRMSFPSAEKTSEKILEIVQKIIL